MTACSGDCAATHEWCSDREVVGKIRVLSVDGEVAIAEVIEDGLRGKETAAPAVRSLNSRLSLRVMRLRVS